MYVSTINEATKKAIQNTQFGYVLFMDCQIPTIYFLYLVEKTNKPLVDIQYFRTSFSVFQLEIFDEKDDEIATVNFPWHLKQC